MSSEGGVVSRVLTKHVVKFNVIDFILGPCLEPLLNQPVLIVSYSQTEVVEN